MITTCGPSVPYGLSAADALEDPCHARVEDARQHPDLVAQLAEPQARRIVERLFFIDVVSFDWNCPKYITPRYTAAEVEAVIAPLRQRITELEAQLKTKH